MNKKYLLIIPFSLFVTMFIVTVFVFNSQISKDISNSTIGKTESNNSVINVDKSVEDRHSKDKKVADYVICNYNNDGCFKENFMNCIKSINGFYFDKIFYSYILNNETEYCSLDIRDIYEAKNSFICKFSSSDLTDDVLNGVSNKDKKTRDQYIGKYCKN